MAFFFLVAGLEARRESDMGEMRIRRRLALPLVVGLGGMIVPIGIYLTLNAGRASAGGWGTAMSTDTAFALGLLALVGAHAPDRVSTYLLTFSIVDDVAGIVVIALAFSRHVAVPAVAIGLAFLALVIAARARGIRSGPLYLLLGLAAWIAFFESGVDPVLVGLAIGMIAVAYPATRIDLEQASASFRLFREQPTPGLARDARESVRTAISPNDRLQQLFHPWTSYLIVPLSALPWLVFRVTAMLPKRLRLRALLGPTDTIVDPAVPVDPKRDHVRGPDRAPVTLVEYGDFECPYCGQAEPVIRELLADYGDLRYVWRHLPLSDVHPHAQLAAEAAEAAAIQAKFWPMHDQLLDHQRELTAKDLIPHTGELGLNTDQFARDLRNHAGEAQISEDIDSADLSGVSGTPTFFINGKRHHGAYDIATLSDAVRAARARTISQLDRPPRRRA